ncbi:MAG: DUF2628 domain-containing protein [Siculibacillus sp.]|nr:DUF2628 domain-containing protein [Siculibacillus sp.]
MATWTVHAPEGDLGDAIAADRLVFTREGFAWVALFLPFLWAPFHRLWLVFLGWLGVAVGIEAIDHLASDVGTVLSIAFALWFAIHANDLRRWTLERRGWRLVGLTNGSDLDEAEARFFAKLAGAKGAIAVLPPAPPPAPRFETPLTPPRDLPPIVGYAGVPGDRS